MSKKLKIWTDGGARGNPGPAAAGVVVRDGEDIVWQNGVYLGNTTNNQAEYQALQLGLEKAQQLGADEVQVHMDSQLVVEQVNGRYKVKDLGLQERHRAVRKQLEEFDTWQLQYVPRAQNADADRLVNQALDAQQAS